MMFCFWRETQTNIALREDVIASPVLDPEARAANVEFTQSSRRRQKTPRSWRDTHLSSSRSTRDAVVGKREVEGEDF